MLKKLVNIGTPLSKQHQRGIMGGITCNAGQWVICHCSGTPPMSNPSAIMPMAEVPVPWCISCGACGMNGVMSASSCMG